MKRIIAYVLFIILFPLTHVSAQSTADWYMPGANPARTSWVTEEVRGALNVDWYQPIEPYIPYSFQPVFYNNQAFISTSKGLYVFNLSDGTYMGADGRVAWVYPTEIALGNAPTIATVNGRTIAFTPSYDHTIHAIDITTHSVVSGYTPYTAGAGFSTNPLVVNNTIYAGNRDGYFYALNATTGSLLWRFRTGDSIMFSAAYKNNTVYFASNDLYAYALNATTGAQIWKSVKFPSAGFFSYWPVVYTEKATGVDYVIFTSSENYRNSEGTTATTVDPEYLVPGCRFTGNTAYPPCPADSVLLWEQSTAPTNDSVFLPGTQLFNISKPGPGNGTSTLPAPVISNYYETDAYPHRRATYILNAQTGTEYLTDYDGDGKVEYAPFTWSNVTASGTKYPALVNGFDNILYNTLMFQSLNWIPRGGPVGWKFGTPYVSYVTGSFALDEPVAYAGGGKLMYYSLLGERTAGAFDISLPLSQSGRGWQYFSYNLQKTYAPDYHIMYFMGDTDFYNNDQGWHTYSGKNQSVNGIYSKHMTAQSPPIPYKGKVYMLKGNALIAWRPQATTITKLPLAEIHSQTPSSVSPSNLNQKLESEIQKMITAGHLRPGYFSSALYDNYGQGTRVYEQAMGEIFDYFQNPAETVVTLLQALPHVSSAIQSQIRSYLQTLYGPSGQYPFTTIVHVGWATGAARESSTIPPETLSRFTSFTARSTPRCTRTNCGYGTYPPYSFYAAWKYAQEFGGAKAIFDAISAKREDPPSDSILKDKPYILNQYIAGYLGFLELQKLAGYPETASVRATYNQLLASRVTLFTKDTPWPKVGGGQSAYNYMNALAVARNFMYLTPELGAYIRQNSLPLFQTALTEYQYIAPYWFSTKFDATTGEGTLEHLWDTPSIFQAKAYIAGETQNTLVKYLDVPAFPIGDLFYIQNLVAAIQAPTNGTPTATPQPSTLPAKPGDGNGDTFVNGLDYVIWLNHFNQSLTGSTNGDFNNSGRVDGLDYVVWLNNFGK